jgi:hypothetical protein
LIFNAFRGLKSSIQNNYKCWYLFPIPLKVSKMKATQVRCKDIRPIDLTLI